jgi:thiol-disulfide isomerase/thioredoxin
MLLITSLQAGGLQPITSAQLIEKVRSHASGKNSSKLRLVNIWATWCPPCIKELPAIIKLARQNAKNVKLLLVNADVESELAVAEKILLENGFTTESYWKSGDDGAFIDALEKKWRGALPATFLFDVQGTLQYFWQGELPIQECQNKIQSLLKK